MFYRWFAILLTATIASESPAYAATKVEQCNKLSTAINRVKPIAEKLTQSSKTFETASQAALSARDATKFQAAFRKFANSSKAINQEMNLAIKTVSAVTMQDQTLVGLRNQYVQTSSAVNQGIADLANSTDKMSRVNLNTSAGLAALQQGSQELSAVSTRMSALEKQESGIIDRFNRYCGAK